jgi:cell division initiation protein
MDVTARHIQEKQFHDAWRGYNQEEVDDFLDRVAERISQLERENGTLQSRLRELDQMVEASRSTEDMLKKTLVTAQQAAEEAIATAKAKAEALVLEAETRVQKANEELKQRVATAEEEVRRTTAEAEREALIRRRDTQRTIDKLETFEAQIKTRLRTFLEQQLATLDALLDKGGETTVSAPPTSSAPADAPQVRPVDAGPRLRATPAPARPSASGGAVGARTAAMTKVPETETPGYIDLGDTSHEVAADEGDPSRKNPLRGIFKRDAREDLSVEDR